MRISKIPLWTRLFLASICLVSLISYLGISPIKSSIYLGLVFLILTLVPIHFRKLIRYRRDFGIVSGVLITLHGIISFNTLMNASFETLFHTTILNGYLATIIIVLLIITSNYSVQRRLGNRWRTLHALIWFALPLSFLHALMAAQWYLNDFPILAVCILGGLGIFGIGKMLVSKSNPQEHIRDAVLVLLGVCFAIGLAVLFPIPSTAPTPMAISSAHTKTLSSSLITPTFPTTIPAEEPKNMQTSIPTLSPQGMTIQEVAQHNTQSDCYVVYQGTVYDITTYLPDHPGGARSATRMCGQTIDTFSDQHSGGPFSSAQAQKILVPLAIGKLRYISSQSGF